jgi:hypothetical protein
VQPPELAVEVVAADVLVDVEDDAVVLVLRVVLVLVGEDLIEVDEDLVEEDEAVP